MLEYYQLKQEELSLAYEYEKKKTRSKGRTAGDKGTDAGRRKGAT